MNEREILERTEKKMAASVADAKHRLAAVRTGRASLAIFENVMVDYYGSPTPLQQVAKLSIPEASLVVAQPFDPSSLGAIERAILAADLGLNPANDGKLVRIPIPPLTEERRKQLVKKVHGLAEDARTVVRQVRRESNEEIKKIEKDGLLSEDDARRALDEVQKKTDKHIAEIDALTKGKEKDLMEV